jgi:4-cresol dehydrogenase (hydroxylating)
MQSNYGIVTKMGVWLMPYPETYMPIWVRAWHDDDLAPMLDTLRALSLDGTIHMVPQVANTLIFASFMSRRSQWWDGEDPIPEHVIDRIARELELGRWLMRAALYGDEAVVDHRYRKLKAAFERIPGVEVWGTKSTPDQAATLPHPAERIQGGVPDLEMNFMTGWYGGEASGGHVGFSPVAPLTGADGLRVRDIMRDLVVGRANLDYLGALLAINARSFIHVTMVMFDTANETQVRGAYDTCQLLVREAAKHGYGEYRAHLDFMDLAVDQYSFNDHVQRRFNETIKDALDPNGILSPGKQGIWPAAMRPDGREDVA